MRPSGISFNKANTLAPFRRRTRSDARAFYIHRSLRALDAEYGRLAINRKGDY